MHKTLLLTLLTAAAVAQAPPPAFSALRASEFYRDALTQTALQYEKILSTHCANVDLQMRGIEAKVTSPFQLGAGGQIVNATWKESVRGTACGETRLYNAWIQIRERKPLFLPLLPGHTYAGRQLQMDALQEAVAVAGTDKGCTTRDVIDTEAPDGPPRQVNAAWNEKWTVRACQKRYLVTMHFIPDGKGTQIHASFGETIAVP